MNQSLQKVGFSDEQRETLIGLMLSDGFLETSSPTSNARLHVQFTVKTKLLFDYIFEVFKDWVTDETKNRVLDGTSVVEKAYEEGESFKQLNFRTKYDPVFTAFYPHFYVIINGKKTRVIPKVSYLIENLTSTALAVLIMGDGSRKDKKSRSYEIHTQGQGLEGAIRLCIALYEVFDIKAWPVVDSHKKRGLEYWNIAIAAESFVIWQPLVAGLLKRCGMYEAKMPNEPKQLRRKSVKGQQQFAQFYHLFKDNMNVREDVTYRVPQDIVQTYRSLQQTKQAF